MLLLAVSVASAAPLPGQAHDSAGHALGRVDAAVSCSAPARTRFARALALLHHMTYPQARAEFEQAIVLDPACAMAHWGIAMTLFQPLWPTRPGPAELARGWEATQRALQLWPPTRREQLLIEGAAAFFRDPESMDYWARIRRWEEAMARAHRALPRDDEVVAFFALSHLAASPADRVTRANADRAAALLSEVYARNPDHPGVMHYLVHANDVPGRERELLEVTRRYDAVAPRNPHALHMPTHIYVRLGDWGSAIAGNRRAAEAALEHPAGSKGELVWDEFPHAIEYLVYAYLQVGDDANAEAQVRRLLATPRLEPTFKTAFHLASTRARFALERHAWSEAMALVPRDPATLNWDRFPWAEAVTWHARALGAAREGQADEVERSVARLDALERSARDAGETLFARSIAILRLEGHAWRAQLAGDTAESAVLMRRAAEQEVETPKHAVTPGPSVPGYELLGDLLMRQGRVADARIAYERSLTLFPRRLNALLGAARAARASGDRAGASVHYRALLAVAGGGTRTPALEEARGYLGGQR